MANSHPTSSIQPTEILDPYPERSSSLAGVRQTTHPAAVPDRPVLTVTAANAPTTIFGDSFQPQPPIRRRFALPIASTLATIFGQAALGALMATQTVDPALGLTIFVAWLTCGLALIYAQCAAIAAERRHN